MDGNVNMSVYAKSVETGEEVRLCTFADVPVPSDDKYYFYVPNSLYPLEGAYELSMRYATPDGERGLLNPDAKRQIITICLRNMPTYPNSSNRDATAKFGISAERRAADAQRADDQHCDG